MVNSQSSDVGTVDSTIDTNKESVGELRRDLLNSSIKLSPMGKY
jgi:hypothetical protein